MDHCSLKPFFEIFYLEGIKELSMTNVEIRGV